MEEFLSVFLEESRDILQQLEEDLLELERSPDNTELIKKVFRETHTIKGGAGLAGLSAISSLAHRQEDVLEEFRSVSSSMPRECFTALLKSVDMLRKMVEISARGEVITADLADEIKRELSSFTGNSGFEPGVLPGPDCGPSGQGRSRSIFKIALAFKNDILKLGQDPLVYIKRVGEIGRVLDVNVNFSRLPLLEQIDPYSMYLMWTITVETDLLYHELKETFGLVPESNNISIAEITDIYGSVGGISDKLTGELLVDEGLIDDGQLREVLKKQKRIGEILIEDAIVAPKQVEAVLEKQKLARELNQENSIRVDIKKIESVCNLAAKLTTGMSRVIMIADRQMLMNQEVLKAFQEIEETVKSLSEEVMRISMVPVSSIFSQFTRLTRDMAAKMGKEVELVIAGQETELDRHAAEMIADPMKHMIRNSIDHGIESVEERKALGKPAKGTIWVKAYYEEASVVIEIKDDGRGLDIEKIHRKAVEKGLAQEDNELTPHEISTIIMMSGFSTADRITDISGRGVGMDVVGTNVRLLKGTIFIDSQKNSGTRFVIKLPRNTAGCQLCKLKERGANGQN